MHTDRPRSLGLARHAKHDRRWLSFPALAWLLLSAGSQPLAQTVTNETTSAQLKAVLENRLAQAKAELNRLRPTAAQTLDLPAGATRGETAEYRLMAESLVLSYEQHLDELRRLEALRQRQRDFEEKTQPGATFSEPGPYSILLVDELRDTVQSLSSKVAAIQTSRHVLTAFAAQFTTSLETSDAQLRLLAEQLETSTDPVQTTRLNWQKSFEELRNHLALAKTGLTQTRQQVLAADLAQNQQRLGLVGRQLALVGQNVRFSQTDLDRLLATFDAERYELEADLQKAESENQHQQESLAAARDDLQKALQTDARGTPVPADRAARLKELQEILELRTVQAETSAQRLTVLRQLLEVLLYQRGMWQLRFEVFGKQDLVKLHRAYQRLGFLTGIITAAKPHLVQQIELATSLSTEQRNRLRDQVIAGNERSRAQELLDAYQQRLDLASRVLREVEKMERLIRRWKESLDQERGALPFTARVRDLFTGFSSFAAKLWDFELFAAQDTITVEGQTITGRRSVTVAKVVKAVLILALGYWFCRLLGRLVEQLAIRKLKVERTLANLIRRWVVVGLVIVLVVTSLSFAKIPLTVFAFLGGALAIGFGFGTQTLLKNFVSGILILFERPFRVGDVLDFEGRRGTVTSIGIRSSVLQLGDGTESLIPNSALLENALTNWTYSNTKVRFTVSIGATYGSDTRQIAHLLAEVVARHGLVEREPAPQVLFLEFGDNELLFELRYWVNVRQHNAGQIGSDLRHMIATVFVENGIEMAYPQRDVHLDSASPLKVQLMAPATGRPIADGQAPQLGSPEQLKM